MNSQTTSKKKRFTVHFSKEIKNYCSQIKLFLAYFAKDSQNISRQMKSKLHAKRKEVNSQNAIRQ
jgi:hypothetical protein